MVPVQQFIDYILQHQLFEKNDHVLLAVSGGKDSVLMAQLFKLAGFNFSIAHCNFNLRANEAQRDEAFVKLLAEDMGVPFHVVHFDTKAFAEQQRIRRTATTTWLSIYCGSSSSKRLDRNRIAQFGKRNRN
jgi:tRNA(Ile)-lysidine synthase